MISILNYGVGNINAFASVYTRLNVPFHIVNNKYDLLKAKKILFPGVGSFDNAMNLLNLSGMRDGLEDLVINKEVPILGVCVGMQMFAQNSEEGEISGLGWINANVKKIQSNDKLIVPHMGWNNINIKTSHFIIDSLSNDSFFYFLHSYYFDCFDKDESISNTVYGTAFDSIICKKNIIGVQFHPEKSHGTGLTLLNNFSKLSIC
jgi:glutamine amidotransferase